MCIKSTECVNGSQCRLCGFHVSWERLSLIRAQEKMADCTGTLIVSPNHCTVTSDRKAAMKDWLRPLEYTCSQLWRRI